MQILAVLTIATQIYCAWHALSSGRDRWMYIILFFPLIGCLLYIFMEVLPHARLKRAANGVGDDILRAVDPTRNLRKLREKVEVSGSVRNKHDLALEMIHCGMNAEAVEILQVLPTGVFKEDPAILLDLAQAYFNLEDYNQTMETLARIKTANPGFKSQQGHMLYARSLENMGRWDEAVAEYEGLVRYFSGEEAKCRLGLLLQKLGHTEKAGRLFQEIADKAKRASSDFRKREQEWIHISERYVKRENL